MSADEFTQLYNDAYRLYKKYRDADYLEHGQQIHSEAVAIQSKYAVHDRYPVVTLLDVIISQIIVNNNERILPSRTEVMYD